MFDHHPVFVVMTMALLAPLLAQAMVGAAMLSLLVYPTLMNMLLSKAAAAAAKKE